MSYRTSRVAAIILTVVVGTGGAIGEPPAQSPSGPPLPGALVRARTAAAMQAALERARQGASQDEAERVRQEESDWSPEQSGLRLRIWSAPDTLRIGDDFVLELGAKGNPETLPKGRDPISRTDFADALFIELVPAATPGAFPVVLRPQRAIVPLQSIAEESASQTNKAVGFLPVQFSTSAVETQLTDGKYLCTIKAEVKDRSVGSGLTPASGDAAQKRQRLWFGTAVSKQVTVELFRADPGTTVVYIPRALRVAGMRTFFAREDADRMSFKVPAGSSLGVATASVVLDTDKDGARQERQVSSGIGGNYLRPGDTGIGPPLAVGSEIRLTLFSTNEPVGHMWNPAAGSAYRVLCVRSIPIIGEKDKAPWPKP